MRLGTEVDSCTGMGRRRPRISSGFPTDMGIHSTGFPWKQDKFMWEYRGNEFDFCGYYCGCSAICIYRRDSPLLLVIAASVHCGC